MATRANCNKHQHKESEQISQFGDLRLHQNLMVANTVEIMLTRQTTRTHFLFGLHVLHVS